MRTDESIGRLDNAAKVRPGARVLVIDRVDRVLLLAGKDDDGRYFWYPPGGGSEPGEAAEETARPELWAETALNDIELGSQIWRRSGPASWGGVTYDCRERWFLARVAECHIDTTGFTEQERLSIAGHRWWTVDELAATSDHLVPDNLDELVCGGSATARPSSRSTSGTEAATRYCVSSVRPSRPF